jgi:antitoxin ParD1/3/4
MTMHVNLSSEMESYIKSKVGSGFYGNATEVIRDAVRKMQAEEERRTSFRAAIAVGEADIAAGRVTPYTPELLNEIWEEALVIADSGQSIDPNVCP